MYYKEFLLSMDGLIKDFILVYAPLAFSADAVYVEWKLCEKPEGAAF